MPPFVFALIPGAAALLYFLFRSSGPRVVDLRGKLPVGNGKYNSRSSSVITDLTIHHTATGNDYTPIDAARYHTREKGWPGIGYHFMIARNGTVYQTNSLQTVSYHNGFNNTSAVGVALVGNFTVGKPTEKQLNALVELAKELKKDLPSLQRMVGHKEYPGASTACPGALQLNELRELTGLSRYSSGAIFQPAAFNSFYDPSKADN